MHIPVRIRITCSSTYTARITEYFQLNRLIHVIALDQLPADGPNIAVLSVVGTVFDYEDIPIIENSLRPYGTVLLSRGRVRLLTLTTVLSGLVVAGIVLVALVAHSFNEDFYDEIIVHHNFSTLTKSILIAGGAAVAGFLLKMLVIYRERRTGNH